MLEMNGYCVIVFSSWCLDIPITFENRTLSYLLTLCRATYETSVVDIEDYSPPSKYRDWYGKSPRFKICTSNRPSLYIAKNENPQIRLDF